MHLEGGNQMTVYALLVRLLVAGALSSERRLPISALPVSLISVYPLLIVHSCICDMLVCFNVNYCFHSGGEKIFYLN